MTGLVTAAGGAWNASIVAETLSTGGRTLETFGLGSLITKATREANFPLLAAGVLTMSLALVLLNRTRLAAALPSGRDEVRSQPMSARPAPAPAAADRRGPRRRQGLRGRGAAARA